MASVIWQDGTERERAALHCTVLCCAVHTEQDMEGQGHAGRHAGHTRRGTTQVVVPLRINIPPLRHQIIQRQR